MKQLKLRKMTCQDSTQSFAGVLSLLLYNGGPQQPGHLWILGKLHLAAIAQDKFVAGGKKNRSLQLLGSAPQGAHLNSDIAKKRVMGNGDSVLEDGHILFQKLISWLFLSTLSVLQNEEWCTREIEIYNRG